MKKKPPKHCHQCGAKLTWKKEDGIRRHYCRECNLFVYQNPLPVATVVCLNEKNEVLLIQRATKPGIGSWGLPSGFVELHEPPEEAALRELCEETGIKGRVVTLLGVFTRKCNYYNSLINVCYLVKKTGGKLTVTPEVLDLDFFPVKDLKSIAFKSHQNALREYLKYLKKNK